MSKTKFIVSAVLFVLIAGASIFGIVKLTSIETKNVSPFLFSVGALDEENGAYVENDSAIVTKNVIECQGLTIVPKFDSTVDYKIFFYNEDETYIKCTRLYSMYDKFDGEIPRLAKYCRIVVYPSQFDSDGNPIEEFKVNFYEPVMYASNLTIKVNKEQNFELVDLRDICSVTREAVALDGPNTAILNSMIFTDAGVTGATFEEALDVGTFSAYEVFKVDCSDVKQYKFVFDDYVSGMKCRIYFFANNKIISGTLEKSFAVGKEVYFNVPSGAEYLAMVVPNKLNYTHSSAEYSLYETLLR